MGGEALEGMDGLASTKPIAVPDRDTKLDALRGLLVDISMQAWHVLKPHFSGRCRRPARRCCGRKFGTNLPGVRGGAIPVPTRPMSPLASIAEGIGRFRQAAADAPVGMVPPRRQCKPFLDL